MDLYETGKQHRMYHIGSHTICSNSTHSCNGEVNNQWEMWLFLRGEKGKDQGKGRGERGFSHTCHRLLLSYNPGRAPAQETLELWNWRAGGPRQALLLPSAALCMFELFHEKMVKWSGDIKTPPRAAGRMDAGHLAQRCSPDTQPTPSPAPTASTPPPGQPGPGPECSSPTPADPARPAHRRERVRSCLSCARFSNTRHSS